MAHLRVRASLCLNNGDIVDGHFTSEFRNRLDEKADYFRSKVLLPINSIIKNNWSVEFKESTLIEFDNFVEIYVEVHNDAEVIKSIINNVFFDKCYLYRIYPFHELN